YLYRVFYYFFFFSSRRRHTRSKRDWSSDVCSSDLLRRWRPAGARPATGLRERTRAGRASARFRELHQGYGAPAGLTAGLYLDYRSEERRVGKECRVGWWTCQ